MSWKDATQIAPVDIPDCWSIEGFSCRGTCDVWNYTSMQDARDAAEDMLGALGAASGNICESGYLDLSGRTWGCAYEMPEQMCSLVVTMMPSSVFDDVGWDNPLKIKIVRYNAPALEGVL